MREHWADLVLLVRTAVRTDPWRSLGSLLEPLGSLMFPLFGWFLGLLVDGLLTHDDARLRTAAAGLLATIALRYVAAYAGTAIRTGLAERVGFAFDEEIARLAGGLPGLAHQEHTGYRDRLELLRQSQGALGQSLNHVVSTANAVVGALGTAVVLVLVHPLVLLLVLFALPALPLAALQQRGHARAEEASAAPARLARHLRGLALDPRAAPELRVLGLGPEVLERLDRAWTAARGPLHRAQAVAFGISAVRSLVFAVGFALAVGFVLWRAARGQANAGEVVTAVVVCQQVQNQVLGPAYGLAGMGRVLRAAGRLRWLRAHAAAATAGLGDRPAPDSLGSGIELSEVSFRYPGTETWVLRDVSVRIPPGTVVAVVGENGAGKSTVVKLLTRLYEPTRGRVLVAGTELAEVSPQDWRRRVSGAFQDFARPEFAASYAVGLGDLPHRDDLPAVRAALARATTTDLFSALPQGPATQLGSTWPGGVDLSTGQWQQLALGRALMRPAPLLVCFDEPTASLDAPTEHALFERYAAAARAGRAAGAVTVLVSHRFSTVRSADLILVVDRGRIAEAGTHADLMERAGLYAELYAMQARSHA
ncbi:ABC transporter ATP-binding protein [Actinopolymorpha sp. NPDC004070]|uniref:ABC transporter ATP-binding protein n=1 Tax=Actinopolymorpha sp. NPDC004070 TaxID=3154548 RepID=UPI0033A82B2F